MPYQDTWTDERWCSRCKSVYFYSPINSHVCTHDRYFWEDEDYDEGA